MKAAPHTALLPRLPLRAVLAAALWGVAPAWAATPDAPPPSEAGATADPRARVFTDNRGSVLLVDGTPFLIKGMNWGYMPIGQNYQYGLWAQSDRFIEEVLHREMAMLKDMGVNSIRQFDDIPPRWVTWIHENYGIWTMVNPHFGRYGLEVEGQWVPTTDYSNAKHRAAILHEVKEAAERFEGVPGVLMFMLGNENNYGLVWSSFEIEALPEEEKAAARAEHLYTLFGEAIDLIHEQTPGVLVSINNGDLQHIDLVAEHAGQMDLLGTNVYRGATATGLYDEVREKLNVPVFYGEFGADAFDAARMKEDAVTQARYARSQWQDVYLNTYGRGAGNAVGGYQFQWSDGWWKYKQTENLDVHDPTASWPNKAYGEDFVEGRNNMNEEWFGITAKGFPDEEGHFLVFPRPAYYAIQSAWELDPYDTGVSDDEIRWHFGQVDPAGGYLKYKTEAAAGDVQWLKRAYVRGVRLDLSSTMTEDHLRTGVGKQRLDFDHTESLYVDLGARPTDTIEARVSLNVLGNVAQNPIDPLTYESRAGKLIASDTDLPEDIEMLQMADRLRIYAAEASWDHELFKMNAFYRVGHFHWGYEGDFFGVYQQAFYGENIDIYDAAVPIGAEFEGRGALSGLALAIGPQLYWGANPAVFARYGRNIGKTRWTLLHQEDLAQQGAAANNRAIPQLVTRKTTLHGERNIGQLHLDLGGIMAGTDRLGMGFEEVRPSGSGPSYLGQGYHVLEDEIGWIDTLGTKAKLTWEPGPAHIYLQGAYRGLVADGGPDQTTTFTGWSLKDHGQGNGLQVLSGVAIDAGKLQIAPNFMFQKPLVGPNPSLGAVWDADTGYYYAGLAPRNTISDPFAVLGSRETIAGEMLFVFDPTPGTWFWAWDNPLHEDAPMAAALDLVYRHQPTSRDAVFGFDEAGTLFAFSGAPPASDVWNATLTLLGKAGPEQRIQVSGMVGSDQSTGDDPRLVTRTALMTDFYIKNAALKTAFRWNDWGPYDFHRTFNLTFPFQAMADLSTGVRGFRLEDTGTRLGTRFKYRTFDEFSPDPLLTGSEGHELEFYSYLTFQM